MAKTKTKKITNSKEIIKKKIGLYTKSKPCSIGSCGSIEEKNICEIKRPPGYMSDIISFESDTSIKHILDKRFYSYSLLQEPKQFNRFILNDFILNLTLISYNPPSGNDKFSIIYNGEEFNLSKLLAPLR